jgi:hypothetical protein
MSSKLDTRLYNLHKILDILQKILRFLERSEMTTLSKSSKIGISKVQSNHAV